MFDVLSFYSSTLLMDFQDIEGDGSVETSKDINGAVNNTQDDVFETGSIRSGGVDGSIESDAEATKAEQRDGGNESQDAIPRYTVKKTSSFKPVSVTRNFLMKAGSTAGLPPKTSIDKGLK